MFKQLITGLALIASSLTFSQVGIGTETPHASSDLELGSANKALYLNRVANPETDIANPQPGMVLYDASLNCIRIYQGNPPAWSDCLSGTRVGNVSSLTCGSALFNPAVATAGASYTGTLTIPYSGGNGGAYEAQSFVANGLTFTLTAGSFTTSTGNLEYHIAGMPTASGTTSVNITAGGQTCTGVTLTVNQNGSGVLPSTITLVQNRRHWIASVYDTDYLPYTAPTGAATIAVINAGGGVDTTVNVQGSITTTGVTVQIPATTTGTGTIGAWTSTFVVPAMYAEDGQSRTLELSWGVQNYDSNTKFITATIKSLSGTFNAKKLDINAGIGNDYLGLLLGAFQYPYNNAGTLTSYQVRDIPGIPDRKFGLGDIGSATPRHNFLYLPVQTADGKIWLNNNLGANYANIDNAAFNPVQQATSLTDYHAYGSYFQWGRNSDGHELMNFTSGTSGTPVSGNTTTLSPTTTPANSLFILNGNGSSISPFYWSTAGATIIHTLWQGESGLNNPCPYGFKVPSMADFQSFISASGITDNDGHIQMYSSELKLPLAGYRHGYSTNIDHWSIGAQGLYATTSLLPSNVYRPNNLNVYGPISSAPISGVGGSYTAHSYGNSVRCIAE